MSDASAGSLSLVTGASGHLGNAIVRALLARGVRVRATVREPRGRATLSDLVCEAVEADLVRPPLDAVLEGVDTVYQVAAVFRHWAPDPLREIVEPNLAMTRNLIEAAARAGVKRIVHVSSAGALDRRQVPIDERSWNPDLRNPYYRAKTLAERRALDLSRELRVPLVSVLPWAIVGPCTSEHLTPTMGMLAAVLLNRLPFDPGFHFNVVHVDDVAHGCIAAAERGRPGERYLLGNEADLTFRRIAELAHALYPEVRVPPEISALRLRALALWMELRAVLTRTPPAFRLSLVDASRGVDLQSDISKARRELGFDPRPPEVAVAEALRFLRSRTAAARDRAGA